MDIDKLTVSIEIGDQCFEDTVSDTSDIDRVATLLAFLLDTDDSVSLLDRLRSVEERVDTLDEEVGGALSLLDEAVDRLDAVEDDIDENSSMFQAVADKLEELEQDVSSVQSRLDDGWQPDDGDDDSEEDGSRDTEDLDIIDTGGDNETSTDDEPDRSSDDGESDSADDQSTDGKTGDGAVSSLDSFNDLDEGEQDRLVVDVLSEVEPAAVTEVGSVLLGSEVSSQTTEYADTREVLERLRDQNVVDRDRESGGRRYLYRVVDADLLDEDDSDSGDEGIDDAAGDEDEPDSDAAGSEVSDDPGDSDESSGDDGDPQSGSDHTGAEVLNADELDDGAPDSDMADHAKEPVSFQRARSRKKGGHYLRCFQCAEDFDKLGFAEDHHDETGHDEWLVRLKSLRQAGVYDAIDEELEYPMSPGG